MSGIERKIEKIERQIGAKDIGDSGMLDYGEYVRGCKELLREIGAGKKLEDVLKRSGYSEKLKKVLSGIIPKMIKKLKKEGLWECEKL